MTEAIFPNGRFFEDFAVGELIEHAVPRTLTAGDAASYQALYGLRQPLFCAVPFAEQLGLADMPLADWLVFHIVFGKSVPDISRNAVANLGYAQGRFFKPVFVGDTLKAQSKIIGLRQNSNGESGLVMVETFGVNQHGETVLSYIRWVMVKKNDRAKPAPQTIWPELAPFVSAETLPLPAGDYRGWDKAATGKAKTFGDYAVGDRLLHGAGCTQEEAEHMLATRLYQNNAAVHFDAHMQSQSRFGKRLIYGGHMISHAHAMAVNGLENIGVVLALNGGTHAAPVFAGDTIYGWSEILDKAEIDGRDDVGALRVRHVLVKNRPADGFPLKTDSGKYADGVVLDLDVWLSILR